MSSRSSVWTTLGCSDWHAVWSLGTAAVVVVVYALERVAVAVAAAAVAALAENRFPILIFIM